MVIAVWFMSMLEKKLHKIVPEILDLFVTPLVTVLVTGYLTLTIIGPVFSWIENGVLSGMQFLITLPFGIGAAVPADSIDPDYGMIYAVQTMVGDSMIFKVICIAFLITLFANMAAWSFGVNSVARYAAEHGNMPKVFASMISDDDMPNGANLVNAIVASLVLCLQLVPIDAISNGVFWMLFGTSVVFLLLTYIPMFPAFWRLRKYDDRPRVFRAPFEGKVLAVALAVPVVELVLSIVATIVPLNSSPAEMSKLPILMGVVIGVLLGEVSRLISRRGRSIDNPGVGARGTGRFAPKQ